MSTFTNTVRKLTVDECDRQKRTYDAQKADDLERLGFFSNSMSSISLWRIAGSAGRAVTWLEQLDAEHPDARPHDLVEQLEMRIEDEISAHPRTFTIKHLHGVLDFARQAAAEQLVDHLMDTLGITPQPWQLDQLAASRTTPALNGIPADISIDSRVPWSFTPESFGFIDAPPTRRPTWPRRAGRYVASWFSEVLRSIPHLSNDSLSYLAILTGFAIWITCILILISGIPAKP